MPVLSSLTIVRSLSLGFMIGKEHANGYATEVCQKIIDYADKMINTDFIRVCVNEKNTGSIELCKKLGFKEPKEYMRARQRLSQP